MNHAGKTGNGGIMERFSERYGLFHRMMFWRLLNRFCRISWLRFILQRIYRRIFPFVRTLQLHITSACNYNCIYCYAAKNAPEVFPSERWIRIIQEAGAIGVSHIDLMGGEPFLYKDLYRLLTAAQRRGMGVTIVTNGTHINDEWLERLKKMNSNLILCVKYDYNRKIYEKHTGSDQFERIKRNITACVQNGIMVIAFVVVTKLNIGHIREIINDVVEMGALPVCERYIPVKDEKTNEELELSREELSELSKSVKAVYSRLNDVIEAKALLRSNLCTCFGNNSAAIMQDGSVLPCAEAPAALRVGNIGEESLLSICRKLQKKRKIWNALPAGCARCESRSTCGGGCHLYSFLKKGSCREKDPLCNGDIPPTYGLCGVSAINLLKSVKAGERKKFLRKI